VESKDDFIATGAMGFQPQGRNGNRVRRGKMKPSLRFAAGLVALLLAAGIPAADLNETQRLAGLCRVWGFLKYYNNNVSRGGVDWNQALLDAIPGVKAAADDDMYQHELLQLLRRAGYSGKAELNLGGNVFANVDWKWLDEAPGMTPLLAGLLRASHDGHDGSTHFYYGSVFTNGNLDFAEDQKLYASSWIREGTRLFSLFCYWNIIEYFFPYKNLMDQSWDQALLEFIPRFQAAASETQYHLLVKELGARLNDSHGGVYSELLSNHFNQGITVGFDVSYVEGRTVVTRVYPRLLAGADVRPGDVITRVNGSSTAEMRTALRRYIQASNEPTLQRNLNRYLLAAPTPAFVLTVERDGQAFQLPLTGVAYKEYSAEVAGFEARIPAVRKLDANIGYIHMGALTPDQVTTAIPRLRDTQAIVFDVRNYPQGTIWTLGNYLFPELRPWAKFLHPLPAAPGYFGSMLTRIGPAAANPDYYPGQIVILANEVTQSQAEYTCMALQATGRSTLIGSQTAGADGNASFVYLPGKISAVFTGLGTFYPDGRQTQRIGIVPDIECRPTIAGIRAGRDEVLERALRFIRSGN
jgi:C-terminal processing protease CtpA/Prc